MRRLTIATALVLLASFSAEAQLGDLLKKIDPNKVKKGVKVVAEASREFTLEEETDIGRVVAARILATYPLAKNDELQTYVTLVGNTVAAYSARPDVRWHFAVIDADIVNAFSAPGGFIFITTAALAQIKSEAELAAVLGHEIGHATQKHVLKEIKRAGTLSASLDLAKDTSLGSRLNDDLSERIGQVAAEKLFTSGLSRRDENEADRIGVELAAAAGYRAAEFVNFLTTLQSLEGKPSMKVLVATHPRAADRIGVVKPLVANATTGQVLAERWRDYTQPSGR
jgi:predicted Zn-dependent protease